MSDKNTDPKDIKINSITRVGINTVLVKPSEPKPAAPNADGKERT